MANNIQEKTNKKLSQLTPSDGTGNLLSTTALQ